MADIRSYMKEKEKREKKQSGYKQKIIRHKLTAVYRVLLVVAVFAAVLVLAYIQYKRHIYTTYDIITSVSREDAGSSKDIRLGNSILTYSKDGISYTDYKGNAMWNQTYDMQSPCVSVRSGWVAVGDYNGNLIYDISQDGTSKQIDTNLPVKSLSVAANGVVAAILEDGDVTWINVYNPTGEKAVGIKTTMQKSGYPVSVSLSDNGKLMMVAYLKAESGSMKSIVSFYNFDEVGQNYTDTMVSSYEYSDTVIPLAEFTGTHTAYSVGNNQFMLYEGNEIPKNIFQNFMQEEVQDVRSSGNYVAFIFNGTNGNGKYRIDIYNMNGTQVLSLPFAIEYRDALISDQELIIYNEAECLIYNLNGKEKYSGPIPEQTQLLKTLGGNRFLAVTVNSIDMIEMK